MKGIITDRKGDVRGMLAKEFSTLEHHYDIWHVAKSFKKEMMKKAARRGCRGLMKWIRHITNHFWYSIQECENNYERLIEVWVSCLNHVCNVHSWISGGIQKSCLHAELAPDDKREIAWLQEGSSAFEALKSIVLNAQLLKSLKQCTGFFFTSDLENFHSL